MFGQLTWVAAAIAYYLRLLMRLLTVRLLMVLKTNIQRNPPKPIAAGNTNTTTQPTVVL